MDPAEVVFRSIARAWSRLWAAASQPPQDTAALVTLESHREHFQALAALLTGEFLEVRGAEDGVGGVSGSVLLLPKQMSLFPDAKSNLESYRVRIAISCVSHTLGFYAAEDGQDPVATYVASLLAVRPIRARLAECYPAGAHLAARLEAECSTRRPPPAAWNSTGGVLELWTQQLLRGPEAPDHQLPKPARDFIDTALRMEPATAEELHRATRELLPRLRKCTPRQQARLPPGVPLWGFLLPRPSKDSAFITSRNPHASNTPASNRQVLNLERAIRARRHLHRKQEDKPLYHMFEKVETAEEHRGEGGTPDAEGDLRQMEEALTELSLGTVVRTTEAPANLVRADLIMEPNDADLDGSPHTASPTAFRYPEWDFKKQSYLDDHCTVIEQRLSTLEQTPDTLVTERAATSRREVDALRMHLLRSLYRRRVQNRQLDGPDIDVEAVVERHADLAAGHTPPERLYVAGRRAPRDVAILVLLDTSFSTDAWLEGRRVLDVEMESLLILADAFAGHLEEEVAVATFHSNTRHDVRFTVLKDFRDRWETLRQATSHVAPGGYTRIGAAIRHGCYLLDGQRARHKLLLLLSDGKPTDYDRYEGRHGVEDVRRAVREGTQGSTRIFALAVEKEAKLHLARMLGPGSYRILPRTTLLPDAMAQVFLGMVHS